MRSSNIYLMQGTAIIAQVMELSDLLKETGAHPEIRRLTERQRQAVRTILNEELKFQREQLTKLLTMVTQ
jgi:hypothetical protein